MSSNTAEFDLGNFPTEQPTEDEIEKDLENAIEALEKYGWTKNGWGSAENGICILNAAGVNKRKRKSPYPSLARGLSTDTIGYIHKAIWPKHKTAGRRIMAHKIMGWNDMRLEHVRYQDDKEIAQNKAHVIRVLRKAIKLRREDREAS